ncbi:hypothetical protein V8E54_006547 [Elaphomyces granulatus]
MYIHTTDDEAINNVSTKRHCRSRSALLLLAPVGIPSRDFFGMTFSMLNVYVYVYVCMTWYGARLVATYTSEVRSRFCMPSRRRRRAMVRVLKRYISQYHRNLYESGLIVI